MRRGRSERFGAVVITAIILCVLCALPRVDSGSGPLAAGIRETLSSERLGEEVAIEISLPASYGEGEARYPVICLIEPGMYFKALCGTIEAYARIGGMPEAIVVGIATGDRWRDFTPTRAGVPNHGDFPQSGHAAEYRAFVETEVVPYIEGRYRTQPLRVLYGHSLAGLFVIGTLLEAETVFGGFIATSPSLWWDGRVTLERARSMIEAGDLPAPAPDRMLRLFFALGGEDVTMQEPLEQLVDLFSGAGWGKEDLAYLRFEQADHMTIPLGAFIYGLRHVFSDWRMPDSLAAGGVEGVSAYYDRLSVRYGYTIPVPEPVLNRLGYERLQAGDTDGAILIFTRNTELYPGSWNVWDSLAEAYLGAGDRESARRYYSQSLELNPENDNARRALEQIGEKR